MERSIIGEGSDDSGNKGLNAGICLFRALYDVKEAKLMGGKSAQPLVQVLLLISPEWARILLLSDIFI